MRLHCSNLDFIWYSLIDSSLTFNLNCRFRHLHFKHEALGLETHLKVYGNLKELKFLDMRNPVPNKYLRLTVRLDSLDLQKFHLLNF